MHLTQILILVALGVLAQEVAGDNRREYVCGMPDEPRCDANCTECCIKIQPVCSEDCPSDELCVEDQDFCVEELVEKCMMTPKWVCEMNKDCKRVKNKVCTEENEEKCIVMHRKKCKKGVCKYEPKSICKTVPMHKCSDEWQYECDYFKTCDWIVEKECEIVKFKACKDKVKCGEQRCKESQMCNPKCCPDTEIAECMD